MPTCKLCNKEIEPKDIYANKVVAKGRTKMFHLACEARHYERISAPKNIQVDTKGYVIRKDNRGKQLTYTYNGETLTSGEWAKRFNVPHQRMYWQLINNNPEKVLGEFDLRNENFLGYNYKKKTMTPSSKLLPLSMTSP